MAKAIPPCVAILGFVGISNQVGRTKSPLANYADLLCDRNSDNWITRKTNVFWFRYVSSYRTCGGNRLCYRIHVFLHCNVARLSIGCYPHYFFICCSNFRDGVYNTRRTINAEKGAGYHLRSYCCYTLGGLNIE